MRRLLTVLLALLACSSCDKPVHKPAPATPNVPQRIVSIVPSVTETLYALGQGHRLVGNTEHCDYPAAATLVTKVGGIVAQSISKETILSLQPDLVIGVAQTQGPFLEELQGLGLPVLAVRAATVQETLHLFTQLGALTGAQAQATALRSHVEAQLAQARAAASAMPVAPLVFYQVWSDPLMTVSDKSFIGELLRVAGAKNMFAGLEAQYPVVSVESVLHQQPDVILGPNYHNRSVLLQDFQQHPHWRLSKAVQQGHVYLLDGRLVSRPGPRIGEAVLAISEILQRIAHAK